MNCKGDILIKEFIERLFTIRIHRSQCSLVNVIDSIIQCLRINHLYEGTIPGM